MNKSIISRSTRLSLATKTEGLAGWAAVPAVVILGTPWQAWRDVGEEMGLEKYLRIRAACRSRSHWLGRFSRMNPGACNRARS